MTDSAPSERYMVIVRPQARQEADQTWRAWYPESDWDVSAFTRDAALTRLHDEYERRLSDRQFDTQPHDDLLERALAETIPGVEVIEHDEYLRLRSGSNFQQDLDQLIAEMDEHRD